MIKPASRSTLHDNVLSQLVASIRAGKWQPGDRLPGEQELARQFQVSRNGIREVLKALALAGVLEAHPGQGTFLTRDALIKLEGGGLASTVLGDASLWELVEVRRLLEGHVTYLAAKRATDEDVVLLQQALQSRKPEETYKESDFRFHKILATMAGNGLLTSMLNSVRDRMDELRRHYSKLPGAVVKDFDREHREIFEKIRERDAEAARHAMMQHLDSAWMDALYVELTGKAPEK